MEKLEIQLTGSGEIGLAHDTRKDVRTLARAVNILIEKVNELVEENNRLRDRIFYLYEELSDGTCEAVEQAINKAMS